MSAALGVAQVERLDEILAKRSAASRSWYESRLAGVEGVRPDPPPRMSTTTTTQSWFVYAIRLADGVDRDATIARLAERGIASKAYLPCIHLFPHLRELGYGEGRFPVAEAASAHSLALPFFSAMSEGQVDRVCQGLASAIRSRP